MNYSNSLRDATKLTDLVLQCVCNCIFEMTQIWGSICVRIQARLREQPHKETYELIKTKNVCLQRAVLLLSSLPVQSLRLMGLSTPSTSFSPVSPPHKALLFSPPRQRQRGKEEISCRLLFPLYKTDVQTVHIISSKRIWQKWLHVLLAVGSMIRDGQTLLGAGWFAISMWDS